MALPSGTNFPGAIDGVSNGFGAVATGDTITAPYANDQTSAILALETVVGANPLSGSPYSTIGAALAGKPDITAIQSDTLIYAADTGSANAYAISLSPTPPTYAAGQMVVFKAANANTSSSTLAVNGQAAKALVKDGGAALIANDIVSGQIVVAVYDGTQFQMLAAVTPAMIQSDTLLYAASTIVSGHFAVTLSPAPPSYTAGQMVVFQAASGASTPLALSVNGQAAKTLVRNDGSTLDASDIQSGQMVVAIYDGTYFQVVSSPVTTATVQGSLLTYAADTGSTNAFAITLAHAPPDYPTGQMVIFQAAHTNTSSCTLNVNSLGAKYFLNWDGTNVQPGQIQAGQLVVAVFNGSNFRMLSTLITPATLQNQSTLYASDSGSANAYAVTLSPTPPSYTAGQMVVFQAANANTGASTLAVNGGSAQALVDNGGSAFVGGEIAAGQIVAAVYDGSQFQLLGAVSAGSGSSTLPNTVNEYRLTLVSGTPVTGDDSWSGSSTVYLTPYTGDRIALYTGSGWTVYMPGELSFDASSLASDGVYDLFVQVISSVPTLVYQAWSDSNDRATDIVLQDGVYVLSGDPTQRWVGTFALDGSLIWDYMFERYLFNADNRLPRAFQTNDDTFSTNYNSWQQIDNVNMVIGTIAESIVACSTTLGAGDGVSTACDFVTNFGDMSGPESIAGTIGTSYLASPFTALPTQIGKISVCLFFQSSISGNTVNLLDDGAGNNLTNMTGVVWM